MNFTDFDTLIIRNTLLVMWLTTDHTHKCSMGLQFRTALHTGYEGKTTDRSSQKRVLAKFNIFWRWKCQILEIKVTFYWIRRLILKKASSINSEWIQILWGLKLFQFLYPSSRNFKITIAKLSRTVKGLICYLTCKLAT